MSSPNGVSAERLTAEDSFEDAHFSQLDLPAAHLRDKEFVGCTFGSLRLQETVWHDSRLEDCVFRDCDLTGAKLSHVGLRGVSFERCKLMGIDWSVLGDFPEVSFDACDLRYSVFAGLSLRRLRMIRCTASEVSFSEVDLSDANFDGTDLSGTTFQRCTLTRADLRGAHGLFLDPTRNKAKGARVATDAAVRLAQSLGLKVDGGRG
jgi:fluoroquinolone resistance protein